MKLDANEETHWLGVLAGIHARLRKVSLLGVALFVVVVGDWFLAHGDLAEQQQRLPNTIRTLLNEPQYHDELKAVINNPPRDCRIVEHPSTPALREMQHHLEEVQKLAGVKPEPIWPPIQAAELRCFKVLSTAVQMKEEAKSPTAKTHKVWEIDLPETVYRLVILMAPFAFLAVTLVSMRQLRVVHATLYGSRQKPAVQQVLNSPYFNRVTRDYGEGGWVQVVVVGMINSVHVLNAVIYIPAVVLFQNIAWINFEGERVIDIDVAIESKPNVITLSAIWYAEVLIALVLWGCVVWSFREVYNPTPIVEQNPR